MFTTGLVLNDTETAQTRYLTQIYADLFAHPDLWKFTQNKGNWLAGDSQTISKLELSEQSSESKGLHPNRTQQKLRCRMYWRSVPWRSHTQPTKHPPSTSNHDRAMSWAAKMCYAYLLKWFTAAWHSKGFKSVHWNPKMLSETQRPYITRIHWHRDINIWLGKWLCSVWVELIIYHLWKKKFQWKLNYSPRFRFRINTSMNVWKCRIRHIAFQ